MGITDKIQGIFGKKEKNVLPANNKNNVAIEVDDLVMEFKVTKDKIDTLKEYVIRTGFLQEYMNQPKVQLKSMEKLHHYLK